MFKRLAIAAAAAGLIASPAFAANTPSARPLDLTLQEQTLHADVVTVETGRPVAAVIATDALYGGLAGVAIGAGVALINGNNYGRDIAIGAGIGLIAGGVVGAVDAAGSSGYHSEGTPVMGGSFKALRGTF
jgi:hypothetical protein